MNRCRSRSSMRPSSVCRSRCSTRRRAARCSGQLDLEHLLLLGRQLGRHLLLGAAQHERADAPPRSARPPAFAACRSAAVALVERPRDGNRPGAEVEDRPQLAEVVLDRRAGTARRKGARMPRAASCTFVAAFFTNCASSRITCPAHSTRRTPRPRAEHRVGGDDEVGRAAASRRCARGAGARVQVDDPRARA